MTVSVKATERLAAMTTHSLAIERPRAGTEITIADSTMTGEDDPKFEQVMDLGESNRFARTMHVRVNSDTSDEEDGSKVEEVVIVATDIAAPTATPFGDVHPLDFNTNMENDPEVGMTRRHV